MIVSMVNIDSLGESVLVVVIERDNLERMKSADPISLESVNRDGMLPVPKYPQKMSVLVGYEEDEVELYRRARETSPIDLLRWLERGRKFMDGVDGKEHSFKITERL